MLPLTRSRNRARFFGIPFSPSKLFAAGEQGFFYDPSDLSTLFTDSAGTTPVTGVEQVVGLMLDKSKGLVLGSELVTNGDFSSGTTGWTAGSASLAVSGGALEVTNSGAVFGYASQLVTVVVGKTYKVTATLTNGTTFGYINLGSSLGNGSIRQVTGPGTVSFFFTAASVNCWIQLLNNNTSNGTALYDNISVRELPGNHATSTGAARPTLSARVNLLTKTEQFDDGAWTKNNATAANTTATTDPLGGTTADVYTNTGSGDWLNTASAITIVAGLNYTYSIYAKRGTQDWLRLSGWNDVTGTGTTQAFNAWFNLATGVKGTLSSGADGTAVSHDMVGVGNGWYRCTVTGSSTALTTLFPELNMTTADAVTTRPATGNEVYIWGADLRVSNDGVGIPAYQRVNTATDYDSSGFPLYLRFGGTQAMSTGSIDFTATDKMSVFAGVRKLSDAALAVVAEISANSGVNNGTFAFFAPLSAAADYGFRAHGTGLATYAGTTYTAPITNVTSCVHDIAGATIAEEIIPRVNGVTPTLTATNAGPAGTGNYGNYPLYIGARNLASLFFNGRIYSLIGVGSAVSAGNISATESWVNGRTKAY